MTKEPIKRRKFKKRSSGPASLLPQTAEYALRAMAYIASRPMEESVRARDMWEPTRIPPHYLSKILHHLVLADLLDSQRGHHGGFVLTRPSKDICIMDVLEAVNFRPKVDNCAFGYDQCDGENPCLLHQAWSALNEAFSLWAGNTTLAGVVADPHRKPSSHIRKNDK